MAAKKKAMTAKAARAKLRAPRVVWIVYGSTWREVIPAAAVTAREASRLVEEPDERVVGPYILAERARER